MDTEKWKSVLVPKEVYEEIKRTSADRGRTISGPAENSMANI
jgi:hypothetical protein